MDTFDAFRQLIQEITARDELMERKSGWRQNDIMAHRNIHEVIFITKLLLLLLLKINITIMTKRCTRHKNRK